MSNNEENNLNTAGETKDHCTCPKKDCKLHGNCVACVAMHRKDEDHLPSCFHKMVNKRIKFLSGLTEHSVVETIKEEAE